MKNWYDKKVRILNFGRKLMKRCLAIILTFAIIFSTLVFNMSVGAEVTFGNYNWCGETEVFKASAGVRCIRAKQLSDGTIAAVYYRSGKGNYFARSYDGGFTFENEVLLIANATDSLIENSPYVDADNPYGRGRLEAQNPNFIELENGNLMAFYRLLGWNYALKTRIAFNRNTFNKAVLFHCLKHCGCG